VNNKFSFEWTKRVLSWYGDKDLKLQLIGGWAQYCTLEQFKELLGDIYNG
jgi:hypothetical protein